MKEGPPGLLGNTPTRPERPGTDTDTVVCGDGIVASGVEECDDGNTSDGDACLSTCVAARCGDSIVQAGVEACDDGNADDTDACLSTCEPARCGDGLVQAGVEACDDGNADDTDACLSTCEPTRCGDAIVQAGVEACDDGNADDTDACRSTCEAARCGDGIVQAGVEECDDGNADELDACLSTCERAVRTKRIRVVETSSYAPGVAAVEHRWLHPVGTEDANAVVLGIQNAGAVVSVSIGGLQMVRAPLTSANLAFFSVLRVPGGSQEVVVTMSSAQQLVASASTIEGVGRVGDGQSWAGMQVTSRLEMPLRTEQQGTLPLGLVWITNSAQNLRAGEGTVALARLGSGFGFFAGDAPRALPGRDKLVVTMGFNTYMYGMALALAPVNACGDARVNDTAEACDDGNTSNADACLNGCLPSACGDGYVWQGVEQCEDENTSNRDACLNDCTLATCGDGFLWTGVEECDDGNVDNADGCLDVCVPRAGANPGQVRLLRTTVYPPSTYALEHRFQHPVTSDQSNAVLVALQTHTGVASVTVDGRPATKVGQSELVQLWAAQQVPVGGREVVVTLTQSTVVGAITSSYDGVARLPEGESWSGTVVTNNLLMNVRTESQGAFVAGFATANYSSSWLRAGTNTVKHAETGSGSSSGFGFFSSTLNPIAAPGRHALNVTMPISTHLRGVAIVMTPVSTCRNGEADDPREQCDDGNTSNADACLNGCLSARCGDGYVWQGVEECEDENLSNNDACLDTCRLATCGDGFLRTGVEECDDGNNDSSDACLDVCVARASPNPGYIRLLRTSTYAPGAGWGLEHRAQHVVTSDHDNAVLVAVQTHTGVESVTVGGVPAVRVAQSELVQLWAALRVPAGGQEVVVRLTQSTSIGVIMSSYDGVARLPEGESWSGTAVTNNLLMNVRTESQGAFVVGFATANYSSSWLRAGTNTVKHAEIGSGSSSGFGFFSSTLNPIAAPGRHALNVTMPISTHLRGVAVVMTPVSTCLDGQVDEPVESCDDGNTSNVDACLNGCLPARCGDGYVWQGVEECEDENLSNDDACLNDCTLATCGDGFLRTGVEECDDGNNDDGDDCLGVCVARASPNTGAIRLLRTSTYSSPSNVAPVEHAWQHLVTSDEANTVVAAIRSSRAVMGVSIGGVPMVRVAVNTGTEIWTAANVPAGGQPLRVVLDAGGAVMAIAATFDGVGGLPDGAIWTGQASSTRLNMPVETTTPGAYALAFASINMSSVHLRAYDETAVVTKVDQGASSLGLFASTRNPVAEPGVVTLSAGSGYTVTIRGIGFALQPVGP